MTSLGSLAISSDFSSLSSLTGESCSGFSARESSFFFLGVLGVLGVLTAFSFESVLAFFFGFLSLLVSIYTLIFVFLQCLCFGVRRTFPEVFATTHEGTGWACLRAWDR